MSHLARLLVASKLPYSQLRPLQTHLRTYSGRINSASRPSTQDYFSRIDSSCVSQLSSCPWSLQTRQFAKRSKRQEENVEILANEQLIAEIMKKVDHSSPTDVSVRLVVEAKVKSGEDNPKASVSVVTLSEAIQTAVDLDLDLLAVALDQDVPVIKAASMSSVRYQSRKRKKEGSSSKLASKEFQFKVGIAENDLMRKLDKMKGFLSKGHSCTARFRCPGWIVRNDEEALVEFVQHVTDLLEDDGKVTGEPSYNEQKTHAILKFMKR